MGEMRNHIKKSFFRFLIIFVLLILLFSCPQAFVKGSVWYGKITAEGRQEQECTVYLYGNSNIKVFSQVIFPSDNGNFAVLEGTYTYSETDSFTADISGKINDSDGDMSPETLEIRLEGTMNSYTGLALGDFTSVITMTTVGKVESTGIWSIERIENE